MKFIVRSVANIEAKLKFIEAKLKPSVAKLVKAKVNSLDAELKAIFKLKQSVAKVEAEVNALSDEAFLTFVSLLNDAAIAAEGIDAHQLEVHVDNIDIVRKYYRLAKPKFKDTRPNHRFRKS